MPPAFLVFRLFRKKEWHLRSKEISSLPGDTFSSSHSVFSSSSLVSIIGGRILYGSSFSTSSLYLPVNFSFMRLRHCRSRPFAIRDLVEAWFTFFHSSFSCAYCCYSGF